jgi:hypothetical protein
MYSEEFRRFLMTAVALSLLMMHMIMNMPDWTRPGCPAGLFAGMFGAVMLVVASGHRRSLNAVRKKFNKTIEAVSHPRPHDPAWKCEVGGIDMRRLAGDLRFLADDGLGEVLAAYKLSGWVLVVTGVLVLLSGRGN